MKTIILNLILFVVITNISYSQIISDYPFKTYLDDNDNLYVTGNGFNENTNSVDIIIEKYDSAGRPLIKKYFPGPDGIDQGLDLAVDPAGNIIITGYIYNSQTDGNDIIVLRYDNDGNFEWDEVIPNFGDDKGMGVEITIVNDLISEVFITGYITNVGTGKDMITKKYTSDGDPIWEKMYDEFNVNNVATDIHLDGFHAYVSGYIREKDHSTNNDFMVLSYSQYDGDLTDSIIYYRPNSNEIPVSFSITNKSTVPVEKSRSSVICITDNIEGNSRMQGYLTIFFDEDLNHSLRVRWSKTYTNGEGSYVNVPTSLTVDEEENIYVTGYCFNFTNWFQSNGLDFTTIKYLASDGKYGWKEKVKHFNYNDTSTTGVNDKASSIRLNDKGDVFVAGPSQGSPYGYAFTKYKKTMEGKIDKEYSRPFIPAFITENFNGINLNKWATLEIASDGSPLMIVMGWDATRSYWAAQKYDTNGVIEYTIDPGISTDKVNITKNEVKIENYPNPFNPSTIISYELQTTDYVSLKVYDILGNEVATLFNGKQNAGKYKTNFNGSNLASGIYFYKLILNGIPAATKRMLLVK